MKQILITITTFLFLVSCDDENNMVIQDQAPNWANRVWEVTEFNGEENRPGFTTYETLTLNEGTLFNSYRMQSVESYIDSNNTEQSFDYLQDAGRWEIIDDKTIMLISDIDGNRGLTSANGRDVSVKYLHIVEITDNILEVDLDQFWGWGAPTDLDPDQDGFFTLRVKYKGI